MNLRYKKCNSYSYQINCINIACYSYWSYGLPAGFSKGRLFGLDFWKSGRLIKNHPSGIQIDR